MTRKTWTIIIIALFFLVIGGMLWYFSSRSQDAAPPGTQPEGGLFSRLFPGGSTGIRGGIRGSETGQSTSTPQAAPRLRLVSNDPVSGGVAFNRESDEEDSVVIRYVDRATSHIFETPAATVDTARLTNTTLPGVQNAHFSDDGEAVVFQYLGEQGSLRTFAAGIIEEAEALTEDGDESFATIEGSFLPNNILSLAREPDGGSVAYVVARSEGSELVITDALGGKNDTVSTLPITEWTAEWSAPETILLTTKPSHESFGYAYHIDKNDGSFARLTGRIRGMTASLSPDGETLVYSESTDDGFTTFAFDTQTSTTFQLPIETLPEKCAWSNVDASVMYCAESDTIPPGDYPDVWYQGRIQFSDSIWRVDLAARRATFIVSLEEEGGQAIDAVNLSLSPSDDYLLFMNKRDLRLWSLRLEAES